MDVPICCSRQDSLIVSVESHCHSAQVACQRRPDRLIRTRGPTGGCCRRCSPSPSADACAPNATVKNGLWSLTNSAGIVAAAEAGATLVSKIAWVNASGLANGTRPDAAGRGCAGFDFATKIWLMATDVFPSTFSGLDGPPSRLIVRRGRLGAVLHLSGVAVAVDCGQFWRRRELFCRLDARSDELFPLWERRAP